MHERIVLKYSFTLQTSPELFYKQKILKLRNYGGVVVAENDFTLGDIFFIMCALFLVLNQCINLDGMFSYYFWHNLSYIPLKKLYYKVTKQQNMKIRSAEIFVCDDLFNGFAVDFFFKSSHCMST